MVPIHIKELDKYRPLAYIITMTSSQLIAWRKKNSYSQGRLAIVLAVDVTTVSRWERGVREIPSFLHLALRWLETKEGGEMGAKGKKKASSSYSYQEDISSMILREKVTTTKMKKERRKHR